MMIEYKLVLDIRQARLKFKDTDQEYENEEERQRIERKTLRGMCIFIH